MHAFLASAEPDWRLRVWRTPAAVCRGLGRHRHAFFLMIAIDAGRGHHVVDGRRIELAAGDVCWIAPGQDHDAAGLDGATGWTVGFHADAVEPEAPEPMLLTGPPRHPWLVPFALAAQRRRYAIALPSPQREAVRAALIRLERELEARQAGHDSAARALLMLVLIDLARQLGSDAAPAPRRSALTEAVLQFIDQHYRRPIGLRDVARAVQRSPAYLTDRVRRETGRPVGGWLAERRMAEARRLLRGSDLSTEQVAADSGFGDPRHFARQFRRVNGLPPQAWRAAERSKEAPRRSKSPPL